MPERLSSGTEFLCTVRRMNTSTGADTREAPERKHLYAHLGISMGPTGELTSAGTMPVGSDTRTPGGIRAALLALLVEGGFGGNFLDAGLFPVLDNMTVHVLDGGDGVASAPRAARSCVPARGVRSRVVRWSTQTIRRGCWRSHTSGTG